ncbi:zinc finger BED domain-containing protein 5-like [Watersipora subatra]|uniref:zinc finger BED domain-containing protein 5-like n=1 Tax=Watersipora subatra TaxID=2589382 RepID=UPI00355B242C
MDQILVDRENRHFNPNWTTQFFFYEVKGKLTCLICNEAVAINKVANIKRHYAQNHPDYDGRFPPGTARRQEKLDRLTRQANGQMAMMRGATSLQQKAATAGYEVCYKIAKAMVPYSNGNLFKECMVSAVQALYPEKLDIQQAVRSVPLSRNTTCARWIEAIANHLTEGVIYNMNRCKSFSVAVDESTDINDVAQLSVFVRYYLNNKFSEDLAAVIPLTERTTGENIYLAFKAYMSPPKVSMHKIIFVATDGCPAMFLSEIGGDAAEGFLEILRSEHSLRDMVKNLLPYLAFLTDILAHLNDLNLKLQDESRNVVEAWQAVTYFKDKLHCFHEDINSDMNHFPIIREFVNGRDDVEDLTTARAFLIDVSSEMECRFAAFDSINGIIELVECPFQAHQLWKAQVDNFPHVQRGVAELELCDLKADILAKAQFADQAMVGF